MELSMQGDDAQTTAASAPVGPSGDPLDASRQALGKDNAADEPGQADDLARQLDKMLASLFGPSAANSLSGGGLSGLGSALPSGGAGGQGSSSPGAMPAAGLMSPSLMFAMQAGAQGATAAGGTAAANGPMAGIGEAGAALSAPQGGVASGQVAGTGGAPVLAALSSESAAGIAANVALPPADSAAQAQSLLNNLPWRFEANVGQFAPQTQFVAHGPQYDVALGATQAQFAFTTAAPSTSADGSAPDAGTPAPSSTSVITMQLVGGNASAPATGGAEVATKTNYFIGNDRSQWLTGVPNYASAQFSNVYQGINLSYYGNQGNLEHDFIVSPGANPNQIVTRIDGVDQVSLDGQGDLVIQTAAGPLVEQHPVAYQDVNGVRQDVSSQFVLLGGNEVGVSVGPYDHGNTLVIDPQWVYSSYLGGSGDDIGTGIYVDGTGAAYVVGGTSTKAGWGGNILAREFAGAGVQVGPANGEDVFVAKVAAGGNNLTYLDFLIGESDDFGKAIAVDGSGNAYITGWTDSKNFPLVNAWQAQSGGGRDAFVAKLDPTGANLVFSTYLGGAGADAGNGIAVDATSAQNIDVVGETSSTSFDPNGHNKAPTKLGKGGGTDVLVAQFSNAGQLNYVAKVGGTQTDVGRGVAVDQDGNVYITGYTNSYSALNQDPFPTSTGAFQTNSASPSGNTSDAFVAVITVVGGAPTLAASTYFGGAGEDDGNGIAVGYDPSHEGPPLYVYIVGTTTSDPTVGFGKGNILKPTVLGGANAWGQQDVFVARFDATQAITKRILDPATAPYFVYLSGTQADYGYGIALTTAIGGTPKLYVTGETSSNNQAQKFPTPWSMQPYRGAGDAFVALLDPNVAGAASLLFNTYVGGTGGDSGNGIAVDTNGNAYLTGRTDSKNMRDPRMPALPAFQPAFGGGNQDGFVMEISPNAPVAAPKKAAIGNQTIFDNALLTFTATATTYDGNPPNFFLDGAPSGASIDPNSGVFTWTPTPSQLGSWTFGVQAADAEGRIDEEFITVTVLLQPTTTNMTSSANPSPSGQPVTFTAAVNAFTGTPTGTVTFLDGTTTLGTGTLSVINGIDEATFTTSSLTSGSHAITAIYGGDPMYAGSSGMVAQTIGQASGASSSTSLVSSGSQSSFGQAVTFTATVSGSGGTPSGTVTFLDGTTVLGTGTLALVNGQDQAIFTTSTLVLGQHNITAIYGGDSTFAASSASLSQTVNEASTSLTLTSSADPASYGSAVTFTATVNAPTGGTPTGTVTFVAGDSFVGTATLSPVGGGAQATVTTSGLDFGDYPVFAVYGGDGNFTASTSDPLDQIVN